MNVAPITICVFHAKSPNSVGIDTGMVGLVPVGAVAVYGGHLVVYFLLGGSASFCFYLWLFDGFAVHELFLFYEDGFY